MKSKITIIVIEDFSALTERCLNALKGKGEEIIVFSKSGENYAAFDNVYFCTLNRYNPEALNASINDAQGDFILFLRGSDVPAYDYFEELYLDSNKVYVSNIVHYTPDGLKKYPEDKVGLYGKIFPKSFFADNGLSMKGFSLTDHLEIYLEILRLAESVVSMDKKYIYAAEEKEEWEIDKMLALQITDTYSEIIRANFDFRLLEHTGILSEGNRERIDYLKKIVPYIDEKLENRVDIFDRFINTVLNQIKAGKGSEEEFESLKDFFKVISEDKKISYAIELSQMDYADMNAVCALDYSDYMYYTSRKKSQKNIDHTVDWGKEISKLDSKLSQELTKSIKLLKSEQQIEVISEGCNADAMFGDELVGFTLTCYAQGKLGFKTILKSMVRWMQFKLKGEQRPKY